MVGDNVVVTCLTTGSGPVNFFWTKDHARFSDGTNLQLDHVNLDTAGQYSCIAYLVASRNISKTQSIDIHVFGPPTLGVAEELITVYYFIKQIRLSCRAVANPKPTIMWSTNGTVKLLFKKEQHLVISNLVVKQEAISGNTIKCEARNPHGAATKLFRLRKVHCLGVTSLLMFLLGTLILILTLIVCTKRYHRLSQ
uniref:Ig-like domain-containing protein n=1 Tax=Eptatretus burgeri TaxID=7764 RepID=A0A8C4R2U6_EPTBU